MYYFISTVHIFVAQYISIIPIEIKSISIYSIAVQYFYKAFFFCYDWWEYELDTINIEIAMLQSYKGVKNTP